MRFLGGSAVDEARLAAFVARSPELSSLRIADPFPARAWRHRSLLRKAPGSHAVGRIVEVELISGVGLVDWRHRVLVRSGHDLVLNRNNFTSPEMRRRSQQDTKAASQPIAAAQAWSHLDHRHHQPGLR
jgi:hypothetical protein